jgi:hypothetical protein
MNSQLEALLGWKIEDWRIFWERVSTLRNGELITRRFDEQGRTIKTLEDVAQELGIGTHTASARFKHLVSTLRTQQFKNGTKR